MHGAGAIKAELIERDPYEEDSRRTLGFGHAIAHPLETVTGYSELLHGEAVAFGMAVEAQLAAARGLLAAERLDRDARAAAARGPADDRARAAGRARRAAAPARRPSGSG